MATTEAQARQQQSAYAMDRAYRTLYARVQFAEEARAVARVQAERRYAERLSRARKAYDEAVRGIERGESDGHES